LSKIFAWEEIAMINKKIAGLVLTTVLACVSLPVNKLDLPVTNDVAVVMAADEDNLRASGSYGKKLSWKLYDDGTLIISGKGKMSDDISVPWSEYRDDIYTVSISSGVTSISNSAFYLCTNLKKITIPDSVTSIGESSFNNCTNLKNITIPEGVTSIGENAFYDCSSITKVTIPDSVTSIGKYAFYNCTSITKVTIPDSVTSIGDGAFRGCTSLSMVNIKTTTTDIGGYAFKDTPWQKKQGDFVIVNGVLLAYQGTDSDVVVPNTVNTIAFSSFDSNDSIKSITISDSVTSISSNAIVNCSKLKTLTIPGSVTTIPDHVVYWCFALEKVTMESGVKSIEGYAFAYESKLNNVVIPDTVTYIGEWAFYGCDSLKNITIPASVTEIGRHALGISVATESVIDGFTITGYAGSGAEDYVKNIDDTELWNKGLITFVALKDMAKTTVKLSSSTYTYNGKAKKPSVTVKYGKTTLKSGTDYKVVYSNNTKVGTADVTITGKGDYAGTITKTFKITKAAQKVSVKTTSKIYSNSKVKKASQTFSLGASASGKGKLSYKKTSGNSRITVNKKTGKVTVKKGTAKGTYKIKVQIKAATTSNYKAATVTKTITVKVK
jgi:hypothetical protein